MFEILKKTNILHPPGWLWHNHEKKLSCLSMPKCASNSIRDITDCHDGPNHKHYKDYNVFAVIRNPMDRYISSFMEVMLPASHYPKGRYHDNLGLDENLVHILDSINYGDSGARIIRFTDLILEKGFFETHTRPQLYYLEGCGNITLYKLEKISHMLKDFGIEKEVVKNKTESVSIKKELTDILSTDFELCNKVHKLFAKDIELYESFESKKKANL
jgi:hypothetical protein